jgi:hypothetical protein
LIIDTAAMLSTIEPDLFHQVSDHIAGSREIELSGGEKRYIDIAQMHLQVGNLPVRELRPGIVPGLSLLGMDYLDLVDWRKEGGTLVLSLPSELKVPSGAAYLFPLSDVDPAVPLPPKPDASKMSQLSTTLSSTTVQDRPALLKQVRELMKQQEEFLRAVARRLFQSQLTAYKNFRHNHRGFTVRHIGHHVFFRVVSLRVDPLRLLPDRFNSMRTEPSLSCMVSIALTL